MSRRGQRQEVTGKVGVNAQGQPTFNSTTTSEVGIVNPNVGALQARERNRGTQGVIFGDTPAPSEASSLAGSQRRVRKEVGGEVTGKVGGNTGALNSAARTQSLKSRNESTVNPITGGNPSAALPSPAQRQTQQDPRAQPLDQAQRTHSKKGRNESSINPITGELYTMVPANQPQAYEQQAPPPPQQQQQQQYQEEEEQQYQQQQEEAPYQAQNQQSPPRQQEEEQQAQGGGFQGAGPGGELSAEQKQEFMYEVAADMSLKLKDVDTDAEREQILNEECDLLEQVVKSWKQPPLSEEEVNARVDWAWSTALAMAKGNGQ